MRKFTSSLAFVLVTLIFANVLTTNPHVVEAATTTYYVSPSGNDTVNSGMSVGSPWKTISKINTMTLGGGDNVLFEGGQVFAGTLQLNSSDNGTSSSPITIGSYGTGRAAINAGTGSAITVDHSSYVTIQNVNVLGSGRKNSNIGGKGINVEYGTHIKVENVNASGFQHSGIRVVHSEYIDLFNVYAHDNGRAGVTIDWAGYNPATDNWNKHIHIANSYFDNNPGDYSFLDNNSGNGLVVLSADDVLVEYSEASNNGWDQPNHTFPGGPAGMIGWDVKNMTIQNSIAHDNKSLRNGVLHSDGVGFDIDGDNGLTQYSYSYNNYGPGFLSWNYIRNSHNTLRYFISEHDGEIPDDGKAGIVIGYAQGDVPEAGGSEGDSFSFDVYNNTVFNDVSAIRLRTSRTPANTTFAEVRVLNNIFYSSKKFVHDGSWNALFNGNLYYSNDGQFEVDGSTSLAAWRNSAGKERLNGSDTGIYANPELVNPGYGEKISSPSKLSQLTAYRLQPGSPAIDAGLNLSSAFGINVGTKDFWATSLPQGSAYDIGAYEGPGFGVNNPGFESGSLNGWSTFGTASAVNTNQKSGAWSVKLSQNASSSGSEQVIRNLQPNTPYIFQAWVKSSSGGTVYVGVKNHGNLEITKTSASTSYTLLNVPFTTGSASNSAKVYVWKPSDSTGDNYADDAVVLEDSSNGTLISNASFEQGNTGWSSWHNTALTPSSVALIDTNAPHSGTNSLTHYSGSSAFQQSTYRLVTGLTNGTYTLRAWMRASGGFTNIALGAKNYGGPETNTLAPTLFYFDWTPIELRNIEVTNGQCEIYFWSDAPSGTHWVGIDDIEFFKQ